MRSPAWALEGLPLVRGAGRPGAAVVLREEERSVLARPARRPWGARSLAERCRLLRRGAASRRTRWPRSLSDPSLRPRRPAPHWSLRLLAREPGPSPRQSGASGRCADGRRLGHRRASSPAPRCAGIRSATSAGALSRRRPARLCLGSRRRARSRRSPARRLSGRCGRASPPAATRLHASRHPLAVCRPCWRHRLRHRHMLLPPPGPGGSRLPEVERPPLSRWPRYPPGHGQLRHPQARGGRTATPGPWCCVAGCSRCR